MSYVAMCVVVSYRWQCVLFGILGGNMYCWVFYVAICVVVCFGWLCMLSLLGGGVCYWVF